MRTTVYLVVWEAHIADIVLLYHVALIENFDSFQFIDCDLLIDRINP